MTSSTDMKATAPESAARSVCGSLLLAFSDLKTMGAKAAAGVPHDASAAHRNAEGSCDAAAMHREVAAIIERISAGGNSVQHT